MSYSASAGVLAARTALSDFQLGIADTISACPRLRDFPQKQRSLASEIRDGVGDTAVSNFIPKREPEGQETKIIQPMMLTKEKTVIIQDTPNIHDKKTSVYAIAPIPATPASSKPPTPTEDTTLSNELVTPTRQHVPTLGIQPAETVQLKDEMLRNVPTDPIRADSREIEIGRVIGNRYEILSEISRGGFGIVYRARQIGIDRVVAIKRLHSQGDPSSLERFYLEANIIKDLVHPNTIHLIDAGVDDNHLFLVMEYIEGESLRELIDEEQGIEPLRALNITKQILKSLHEAHERGIIHRDIKPSNILIRNIIGEHDFVKVLDFGIAKVQFRDAPRLTECGKILGTPQYLAPELLYGDEARPSSDIFSVALMLVEMLTGTPLLPKAPASIVKLSASVDPIPLPKWILESRMGSMIQRALEKNPANRYKTTAEMLADIQSIETDIIIDQKQSETSADHKLYTLAFVAFTLFTLLAGSLFLMMLIR